MAFEHVKMDPERTAAEWFAHCRDGVVSQMQRALTTHGEPTRDPQRGVCRLVEEVGEVAEEAANAAQPKYPDSQGEALYRMIEELNQVAGYAMLLRCSMEGEIRRIRGVK